MPNLFSGTLGNVLVFAACCTSASSPNCWFCLGGNGGWFPGGGCELKWLRGGNWGRGGRLLLLLGGLLLLLLFGGGGCESLPGPSPPSCTAGAAGRVVVEGGGAVGRARGLCHPKPRMILPAGCLDTGLMSLNAPSTGVPWPRAGWVWQGGCKGWELGLGRGGRQREKGVCDGESHGKMRGWRSWLWGSSVP